MTSFFRSTPLIALMLGAAVFSALPAVAQQAMAPTANQPLGDPTLPAQGGARFAQPSPFVSEDAAFGYNTMMGLSAGEIFLAMDRNGDGALDQDEFARAIHFNPVFDCVDAASVTEDPRCARWSAVRGSRR